MSETDLSLVLTAHNETLVCGPTVASADLAVAAARAAGFTVQPVIVLDKATEATKEYFYQSTFDHWERWELGEGDLGRVRNAVMPRLEGHNVAFLDADDLFSENWLSRGLALLAEAADRGEQVIAHPEVIITFDGAVGLHQNVAQADPLFTPHFLYMRNAYDSLCLTPRRAHLDMPYIHRDIPNGLSWQDWQFGVQTMSRGWEHVLVPDTIIFKRRRDFSLMVESAGRKALLRSLPEMAIDRIRDLAKPQRRAKPEQAQ